MNVADDVSVEYDDEFEAWMVRVDGCPGWAAVHDYGGLRVIRYYILLPHPFHVVTKSPWMEESVEEVVTIAADYVRERVAEFDELIGEEERA